MKRTITWLLLTVAALGAAQHTWPMERQDRWGTGRALMGRAPATITTPWIFKNFTTVGLTSHGPALTSDGLGYINAWVDNILTQFSQTNGAILGSFSTLNWGQSSPAVGVDGEIYVATVGPF